MKKRLEAETEKNVCCTHCGSTFSTKDALKLITGIELKQAGHLNDVEEDTIMVEAIKKFGGVIPEANLSRQITFADNNIPVEYKDITDGKVIFQQTGNNITLTNRACPNCHANITSLIQDDRQVKNVLLVGSPGAGKTVLNASLFAKAHDLQFTKIKDCSIGPGSTTTSYEYCYYYDLSYKLKQGIPPDPTNYDFKNCGRQPLLYIKVRNTLLVISDYPGEALKDRNFSVPDNATVLYLIDPDLNANGNEQIEFIKNKRAEIHELAGDKNVKEHFVIVKSDLLDEEQRRKIMIAPYEKTSFTKFEEIWAARKTFNNEIPVPGFESSYFHGTDVSCVAALGCKTREEESGFRLTEPWNPQYLIDLLMTLAL